MSKALNVPFTTQLRLLHENLDRCRPSVDSKPRVSNNPSFDIVDDGTLQAQFDIAQRARFEAEAPAEVRVHNRTIHVRELEMRALELHIEINEAWEQLLTTLRHPDVVDPRTLWAEHMDACNVRTGMEPYFVRMKQRLHDLTSQVRGVRADMRAIV